MSQSHIDIYVIRQNSVKSRYVDYKHREKNSKIPLNAAVISIYPLETNRWRNKGGLVRDGLETVQLCSQRLHLAEYLNYAIFSTTIKHYNYFARP